ncbi:MAG: NifU family protein [Alphaproteobacteria bacterium]|nr:MAG: NifU family protein [Alphaproteobacteria bacterium]
MFIQTEETPNPATIKFLPGRMVAGDRAGIDLRDAQTAAEVSPLAARLFAVEGVEGVFLGADFISVSKSPDMAWPAMKAVVLAAIMDHFVEDAPVLFADASAPMAQAADGSDDPIIQRIQEILDQRVRPVVAQDGGDVQFQSFQDGVVYLHMRGACAGCPSSQATLKGGIENLLRHFIPEIQEVRSAS